MTEDADADSPQPPNLSSVSLPLSDASPPAMPPTTTGKRRSMSVSAASLRADLDATLANHPPAKVAAFGHSTSQESAGFASPYCDVRSSKRKRFVFYSVAFATMLAMSSVLDIRRAQLRHRHPKVQLSLPAGSSLSSLSDPANHPAPASPGLPPAPVDSPVNGNNPNLSLRPSGQLGSSSETAERADDASSPTLSSGAGAALPPSATDSDTAQKPADPNLSDQELKDDVDQLIAHVDQEASSGNATTVSSERDSSSVPAAEHAAPPAPSSLSSSHEDVGSASETATGGESSTATSVEGSEQLSTNASQPVSAETDVRLNSEEHFTNARKRMDTILADDSLKKFADENDLRVLKALSLQATHGDCEQKSGSEGGSLFKTDAEAASNVDIERTDPVWGAWCLFTGSYKTDAMRDYVTKQRVVEEKMMAAKAVAETNSTVAAEPFDPNAASLDDVMTPEEQSILKTKTSALSEHLRKSDIRYLAAFSLQATFGDCGPYGREKLALPKDASETTELRKLREPLLDQTVERREGAQWGAWCVLQGTKRESAAKELTGRVESLIVQLTKSQTASESDSSEGGSLSDRASSHVSNVSSDEGLVS